THMESAYLDWKSSVLEISRTVSMAKEGQFEDFKESVNEALNNPGTPITGSEPAHTLTLNSESHCLEASIELATLNLTNDYNMAGLGSSRRIKQISITLPTLLGPYQDIQAVMTYTNGPLGIHSSCKQIAISHGMNDSGQFQLNFDDREYLPFEGLPIDSGNLTFKFPNASTDQNKQVSILQHLNDIILHINYTIR
ncbi:hypothetical protein ACQ96U_27075, partial [Zooshikella sp. RANM57]